MDKNTTFLVRCPKCELPAEAVIGESFNKFFLYKCPKCGSNVVCYKNNVEVISNRMLKKLIREGKLEFCGHISFDHSSKARKHKRPLRDNIISEDDILNLKILLETEPDSAKVLKFL